MMRQREKRKEEGEEGGRWEGCHGGGDVRERYERLRYKRKGFSPLSLSQTV